MKIHGDAQYSALSALKGGSKREGGFAMEPKVTFHHVALSVRDMEESIAWYGEWFDFKVLSRMVIPHNGTRVTFIGNGDFIIELIVVEGAKPLPKERRHPDTDNATLGVKHICVAVDDNRAFVQKMKDAGVEIALEGDEPEMPRYGAHVLDPTGNIIEIFQKDFDVSTIRQ